MNVHVDGEHRVPLWRQLQSTALVIAMVRQGVSGSQAIEKVSPDLRPGVQALAFEVWRNLGRAEAIRRLIVSKVPKPAVDALLCVALALIWSRKSRYYDEFTLVNQLVEAAKRSTATKMQANFLNACLRRFLRERESLIQHTDQDPVARWNHPLWWIRRIQVEYPEHWQFILEAANGHPPMTLRVNQRRISGHDYLQTLKDFGLKGALGGWGEIYLSEGLPVSRIPGFEEGLVSVQDAAAQRAAPLLVDGISDHGTLRILDACAAPGGKTGHLLECLDCDVVALEIDSKRSSRIAENLSRLGLQGATVVTADAAQPQAWWDGNLFDAILLDAPCTASGIVRRHPDIRWLRRETDIDQLSAQQGKLLQTLWALLRPGGRLLYCTCSIFQAEGSQQVESFVVHNSDAEMRSAPGHLLPGIAPKSGVLSDNLTCDHDAFYYALLQKRLD